jgi:hypothetical protein
MSLSLRRELGLPLCRGLTMRGVVRLRQSGELTKLYDSYGVQP